MSSKAIGQSSVLASNRRVHCGLCGWVVRPGQRCGCARGSKPPEHHQACATTWCPGNCATSCPSRKAHPIKDWLNPEKRQELNELHQARSRALEHEDPETRQRIDRGYPGPRSLLLGRMWLDEEQEPEPKYRECIDCGSQDQLDNFGRCEMCSDTRRLYRRFG